MLIQLARCHQHLPSHFTLQTLCIYLSLPLHFSMQSTALELRKSSFDSLWSALICCTVIRQYFSHLSALLPSIHPSRQLTRKFSIYPGWYFEKSWAAEAKWASLCAKQFNFTCIWIKFYLCIYFLSCLCWRARGEGYVAKQLACQQASALHKCHWARQTPLRSRLKYHTAALKWIVVQCGADST